MNEHGQVLALLGPVQPANLAGLRLLERLIADPPAANELMALQPELETAIDSLERVAGTGRQMVERCKALKPVPSVRVPAGF